VTVDLFDFDFGANPRLRLELYDQDEDDIKPFDNRVEYWSTGVGQATHHLNLQRRGPVVAAWNGLFFDLNGQGPGAIAGHLTPVVLGGHIHYAGVGNHRWTFGVKFSHGGPEFKALYHPTSVQTAHEFDFAAGAAQCLIHEGKPLKITPPPGVPPRVSGSALRIRAAETANDAGYIPIVDFIKVSRVSMGWSKDTTHLYLLYVNSPATETENSLKFKHGEAVSNGWNLADLQRFWIAKGVWGAINSDGGGPAQLTYLLPDGRYVLLPPKWASNGNRRVIPADFQGAPEGGSLMYFYIRENGG
jgi:hypothetical protein